jgi:hypothetical protein
MAILRLEIGSKDRLPESGNKAHHNLLILIIHLNNRLTNRPTEVTQEEDIQAAGIMAADTRV